MEADRQLLYHFFEGYKFDPTDPPVVDYYPLEHGIQLDKDNNEPEFQILADKIYENKLKGTRKKFYYLNGERELVSFCKETLKSEVIIKAVESFNVCESEFILLKQEQVKGFKLLTLDGIKELSIEAPEGTETKILGFKMVEEEQICALIQIITRNDCKKPIFNFYKLTNDKCEFIGWSHSRPLINFISDMRIIIGTSRKINKEGESSEDVITEVKPEIIENVPSGMFDFNDEMDDNCDNSNNDCIVYEFKYDNLNFLTELTVSGSHYKDFHVPSKYLYDVIINDFSAKSGSVHIATFPAMNFIQSGKLNKKYSVFGKNYAFVLESGGNVYCYAQPEGRSSKNSKQYLIQLGEEINGWYIENFNNDDINVNNEVIYVLGTVKIYKIALK